MTEKRYRIGITGSYGGMNLGDEAILESIVRQLKESIDALEITVFTKNCDDTLKRHPVDHAVAVQDLVRQEAHSEIQDLDLLIFGGGGILYDRDVKLFLREVELAHEIGIPVAVYAIGTGPLNDPENRKLVVKNLSRAAVVTVRDRQAMKQLEEIGVKQQIILTSDPALLLEPASLPAETVQQEGLDHKENRLIGFSVREPGPAAPDMDIEHYHALLADTADFMISRFDATVVFVPLEQKVHDPQHSHGVISRMRHANKATVLKGKYTSAQLLTLIGHFEFCVGMRLHFLILSAIQGVPFAALPYATKIQGFMEELQMPVPPLKDITAGDLIAYIDRAWDMRSEVSKQISQKIPELKQRAAHTNQIILDILKNHPRQKD